MKRTLILTALIVLMALVPSNEGLAENSCGGQEVTSGIVRTLGWKLSEELLTLGTVWLTSSHSVATCPSIEGCQLILVTCIL